MVYLTPYLSSTIKSTAVKPSTSNIQTLASGIKVSQSVNPISKLALSKATTVKKTTNSKNVSSSSNVNTSNESTSYLDLLYKSNPLLLPFNYLSNMFQKDYEKVDTSLKGLLPGGVTSTEALLTNLTNQNKLLQQVAEAQQTYNNLSKVTGTIDTTTNTVNDVFDKIKPLAYATLGIIALTQIGKLIK